MSTSYNTHSHYCSSVYYFLIRSHSSCIHHPLNVCFVPSLSLTTTHSIGFIGWDDRVGNGGGLGGGDTAEGFRVYRCLLTRSVRAYVKSLRLAGGHEEEAAKYEAKAQVIEDYLRAQTPTLSRDRRGGPGGSISSSSRRNSSSSSSSNSRDTTVTTDPGASEDEAAPAPWYTAYGIHALAEAANAGILNADEATVAVAQEFNSLATVCSFSPFNTYFILQGLGNMGEIERGIEAAKRCWGGMTRLGKGCMWELFDPDWEQIMTPGSKAPTRPSYCHPWSSGVAQWLSQRVLGITASTPGYAAAVVAPHLSAAHPTVSGTVEGGVGRISVKADLVQQQRVPGGRGGRAGQRGRLNSRCEATITVTALASHVEVALPMVMGGGEHSACWGTPLKKATVDGKAVTLEPRTYLMKSFGFTQMLAPGKHTVVAVYESTSNTFTGTKSTRAVADSRSTPAPPLGSSAASGAVGGGVGGGVGGTAVPTVFPLLTYPATWKLDTATQGNWIDSKQYGTEGYVLFSYNSNGTDVSELRGNVRGNGRGNARGGVQGKVVDSRGPLKGPLEGPLNETPKGLISATLVRGCCSDPQRGYAGNGTAEMHPAYLQNPAAPMATHSLRALGYGSSGGDGSQGVVLQVTVAPGPDYRISAYMVGNGTLSRQVVRAMDLETLEPIATTPLVERFDGGVYYQLFYNRSVKLRFMSIDGQNTVSALFLDRAVGPDRPPGQRPAH